ncbi:aldehyde dehydrogenase family protein, partial [candidate division WOR-3 bacterium]|nr:aldehyde dehydrogenase family protein [candidate division WOR-3 bacterium]MBD3365586.1 aldehyde dehydrogenase family protein [candidate division WOR-3 bacterium]
MSSQLKVLNPYDKSLIGELEQDTASTVEAKLGAAANGLIRLRDLSQQRRYQILNRAAEIVDGKSEEFARTLVLEVGKTWRDARSEVTRCVNTLRLSAIEAMKLSGEEVPFSAAGHRFKRGFFRRVPCGVVAAITPFNFPLNLVAHKIAPAFAAGCSTVLKPASATPLSGIKLVKAMHEAGVPSEALQVAVGPGSSVGQALVSSNVPRMVTFTGSKAVGVEIT